MPSKLSMAPPKSAILRLHCCTRIFIEYGQQHQKNTRFYVYRKNFNLKFHISISIFGFFEFFGQDPLAILGPYF